MPEEFVLPPALERGDKVAIVATSEGIKERFPGPFEKGLERLENRFDLEPVIFDTAEKDTEYLNEHPEEKAEDFMKAFEDPEIKGVIAVTGGDEQLRVLKHLEPERLKENPTRFYGLSDNTNLHIYLWNLGIQSFYAGQLVTDLLCDGKLGEYTYRLLDKAFFDDCVGKVETSEKYTEKFPDLSSEEIVDERERIEAPDWHFWNFEEKVEGRLFGGCFAIVYWQLAAGKYMPEQEKLEGSILALETAEDAPSEEYVKRALICMGENGFLEKFSGIIVGRPVRKPFDGEERTEMEKEEYHENQKDRIKKEVKIYCPETPVVFDVDFGHTDPKIPLQLGGKVEVRPEKEEIEFK